MDPALFWALLVLCVLVLWLLIRRRRRRERPLKQLPGRMHRQREVTVKYRDLIIETTIADNEWLDLTIRTADRDDPV